MRVIRPKRHWKQRFIAAGPFVFRRPMTIDGESFQRGDRMPERVRCKLPGQKLRRFWITESIELADFERPNVRTGLVEGLPSVEGVPPFPPGVTVSGGSGNWWSIGVGGDLIKVRGRAALAREISKLRDAMGLGLAKTG